MISVSRKSIVNLRLLGAYEIALDGVVITPPATMKARSLLAYIALRRDETIRRETLMAEFWPDAEATSARNNLKTTLSSLRRVFRSGGVDPDDVLEISRDAVRWIASAVADSRDFERCSADVDDERRAAIAIYRGEFSPGDTSQWAEDLRHRLALRFEYMLRRELAAAPSPDLAERLLALDPFSDDAYTALIETALRSGDSRTAQAVYRRYVAALEEIQAEPSQDLAIRVGLRKRARSGESAGRFWGRVDELAEVERLFNNGACAVAISGIPGIGKTALAAEAARRLPGLKLTVRDGASPTIARATREAAPVEEIALGPLTYDEVAVALRVAFPLAGSNVVDAVWKRSLGYPLVLADLIAMLEQIGDRASVVERLRLSRDLERRFEAELHAAGADVAQMLVFLALEPRLDNDDLAVLLDFSPARVLDLRERVDRFGIAYPFYAEAALRSLSPGRRQFALQRIAERLKLHEDSNAKLRLAEHFAELGQARNAAQAYLEAGTAFGDGSSYANAILAAEAGISTLEVSAPSSGGLDVLRRLHLLRGRALYQHGSFVPAVRSLEALLDVTDERYEELRIQGLITMGHALVRADLPGPASAIAEQAAKESAAAGDLQSELRAQHLHARVLRDRVLYDSAIEAAGDGYRRSMEAHQWAIAASFASLVSEITRRQLHFDSAFYWTQQQLETALLAGPFVEAEARHMLGSVRASVFQLHEALEEFRHALTLISQHRHRRSPSATPAGQLEWMLHHALGHTYVTLGDFDSAVAESEWLLHSPWTLNSALSSWQAASVTVDARLGSGSDRDIAAAKIFLERVPPAVSQDHRSCLEISARARVAARMRMPDATGLLHKAFASLEDASRFHADQIHPYLFRLAQSARGIDDVLAAHVLAAARAHERHVAQAAGALWGTATLTL